ncbi:hypothetical protein C0Z18_08740 [Trinickia dabaoshanensis]|uniref:Acyltransferase 3 domain-containing protein n=1 Tax=Trinickia dabaoshanensis TaxID=564714 RepID=A0A2N7VVR1_9BURK|nr:acyltransferase [Trinickia dabaoshanensis]PMS21244.1 hypothetical protein C0Z18_08740 [Trinickia dabaoshanensis]
MKAKVMNKSFEGLRGVAALLVVLYHVPHLHAFSLFKAGYLAVDLFFVLSGFVMSMNYLGRLQSTADVRDFSIARMARLMPLLVVSYVIYFLIANAVALTEGERWLLPSVADVIATLSMTFGLGLPHVTVYNFASWSISTEFCNYLVFAFLCLMLGGRRRRAYAFLALSLVAGGCVLAIDLIHHCGHGKACMDNVASPGAMLRCTFGFFAGCFAFELSKRPSIVALLSRPAVSLALAASLCYAISLSTTHGIVAFGVPVLSASLIVSLSTDRGTLSTLLRAPAPQALGRLSYSLYLMHMPLLLVFERRLSDATGLAFGAELALFLIVLFIASQATFRIVENPGRKIILRRFTAQPRPEPVATTQA